MEERLRELEEKLQKSEQQRQKLKDNLRFFKEKATNTQELLRQHVHLQGEAEKKDSELSQLRMARQGLQSQLEAIQATSEATASAQAERQGSSSSDSMKALMARLDRVQQTSQDAKTAAQAAAAAARKAEHEALNLQKQNSKLRDRVKDLESKQTAAMDELGRMKLQNASQGNREHLKRKITTLEEQLTAFTRQQQQAHEQLVLWQQAFGAFAQHIAPPFLGSAPANREQQDGAINDALEAQHHREQARTPKRACRDTGGRELVRGSSGGSAPHRHEPGSDAEGTAMHMASGTEADHTSTGTVAGPDGPMAPSAPAGTHVAHLCRAAPLQECSSSRAVVFHTEETAAHHAAPDAGRQHVIQQALEGKAPESSASGNVTDKQPGPLSAMDLVESWLAQLLDGQQAGSSCSSVAAGLAAAIASDACLVPCVIAGFQNTILKPAASPIKQAAVSQREHNRASLADAQHGADFACSRPKEQPGQQRSMHAVLLCAVEVDERLRAEGDKQESLLMLLEQQLHEAALQEEDAWETEACVLAAACSHLYRIQGKQQAMRVLLYDMLMSQGEASTQLLLRISAAITAWAQPLQQVTIGDDELLGQAVLAAQRDMCSKVLHSEIALADDTVTAADTDSGTSSAKNVNPGILRAAQAVSKHVFMEQPLCSAGEEMPAREWPALKGVFEDALKKGLDMAKQPHAGPAAEEQWNALACTIQLAVHCLGISYCFQKAKEHGILDTLKAAMHGDKGPLAERAAEKPRTPSGVAVEMEVI